MLQPGTHISRRRLAGHRPYSGSHRAPSAGPHKPRPYPHPLPYPRVQSQLLPPAHERTSHRRVFGSGNREDIGLLAGHRRNREPAEVAEEPWHPNYWVTPASSGKEYDATGGIIGVVLFIVGIVLALRGGVAISDSPSSSQSIWPFAAFSGGAVIVILGIVIIAIDN